MSINDVRIAGPEGERGGANRPAAADIVPFARNPAYHEYATIEGILEAPAEPGPNGLPSCLIHHALSPVAIRCHFTPDAFARARQVSGKRVAVSGLATVGHEGDPVSIEVQDISELRKTDDLPQFRAGEEIEITGGLDSAEFIRRIRDAE